MIFLDALRVKILDGHRVVNKACYTAVGVDMDGIKHILGLWTAKTEGANFWAAVCADLANRGVQNVFIVCCDGLKGLPEAVEATLPNFHGADLHRSFDQSCQQLGLISRPHAGLESASHDLHRIEFGYYRCCTRCV